MKPMLNRETDKNVFKAPCVVFCIIFFIVGLFFLYEGIEACQKHTIQQSWIETEAYVTQISSRKENSGFGRHNITKTVHDVEYIFDVPAMETYYGKISGTSTYYDTGDILTIKYNPDNPHESTTVLYSNKKALIVNTILSVGFAFGGMLVVIIVSNLKVKNKGKSNGLTERKPYSRKDPSLRGYPVKLIMMGILSKFIIGGVWIMFIVGALFMLMALLAKTVIVFYIAGGISLLMYFIIGILSPIKQINKLYNELGSEVFHRVIDKALEEPKNRYSDYEVILTYLYKACPNIDD